MKFCVAGAAQRGELGDRLFGRVGRRCQRRNQPDRKIRPQACRPVGLDGRLREVVVQVGKGGHALDAGRCRIAIDILGAEIAPERGGTQGAFDPEAGGHALDFTARPAILADRHPGNIAGLGQARALQHCGVDVADMEAGMHHHDRPGDRDPVEVLSRELVVADMQGIEAPGEQRRFGVGHGGLGLAQPGDDGVDIGKPLDQLAFRRTAVERADIGRRPDHALHDMAVALDKAGQQDLVGEAVIDLGIDAAADLVQAADRDDAAVAHRDMGGGRPRRVHGQDLAGREDHRFRIHVKFTPRLSWPGEAAALYPSAPAPDRRHTWGQRRRQAYHIGAGRGFCPQQSIPVIPPTCNCRSEDAASVGDSRPEAQARNPCSRWGSWIPGSLVPRFARRQRPE